MGERDDSPWQGSDLLPFVAGLVAGCLMDSRTARWFTVEMKGYAPTLDLVMARSGRRFRLRLEETSQRGPEEG